MTTVAAPTRAKKASELWAEGHIRRNVRSDRPRVLEAGAGSSTHVTIPGAHLTGLDISAEQLEKHTELDERIVGDIQTHDFEQTFDVIVCWDVLEHVADPRAALRRMAAALAPGGVMVIAGPHPLTVKGIVTKLTPYRAHRAFYRRVYQTSRQPFPTYMRWALIPRALRRYGESLGLEVLGELLHESWSQRRVRKRVRLSDERWERLRPLARWGGLGLVRGDVTDEIVVFRRPA